MVESGGVGEVIGRWGDEDRRKVEGRGERQYVRKWEVKRVARSGNK